MNASSSSTHEDFRRDQVKPGSDRNFGFVFVAFFAIVAAWAASTGANWVPWGAASAVFLALALAIPRVLRPLNIAWFWVGIGLGKFTGPVVMAVLFYGLITPTGVAMRMFGRDPLRLRLDPSAATYWVPRDPPGPEPDSMTRQF